jgi:multiple sugar transport system permease protein
MKVKRNIVINRKTLKHMIPYAVLVFIGILFVVPLLWILLASLNPQATVSMDVPDHFTFNNYTSVIMDASNQRAFLIGLFISLGQSVLVVICAGLCAYPLSRYQLNYKKSFMYTILFMTGLPITAVMVPVFQLFIYLNLNDSIIGTMFFLAAASLPYAIWMMKNFMDSIPVNLEESAWIDGASTLKAILKIIAPLMLPGIFTVGIFTFIVSWGNFFVPYILIQSPEKLPASVTIYQFFGQNGLVQYGKLAAFSILYAMPAVVLYSISQRFMSGGFSFGGASKG